MNSCILITSHLNNDTKIKVALDQLNFLKNNTNLPIIYVGNYLIPTSIQKLVDHCLYIKENPTTSSVRTMFFNGRQSIDYGYAHLHQQLRGAALAKILQFNYIHHLNYDVIIQKEELDKLINLGKEGKFLYHRWGPQGISTAMYSIKTEEFINVINPNLHYYYNENPPGISEGWFAEVFFKWAFIYSNTYKSLEDFSNVSHKLAIQTW